MKILPNGFPGCIETLSPRTRIINTARWQGKGKHITRTIINSTPLRTTLYIIIQLNMFKSDDPKCTCNKLSHYKYRLQTVDFAQNVAADHRLWIHKLCRLRPKLWNFNICNSLSTFYLIILFTFNLTPSCFTQSPLTAYPCCNNI